MYKYLSEIVYLCSIKLDDLECGVVIRGRTILKRNKIEKN